MTFLIAGCMSPSDEQGETAVPTIEASKPQGTWKIEECSFYDKPDPERVGDILLIASSGPSSIERAGTPLPLELTLEQKGNSNQFDITFATNEDSLAMGGGGPRPGLLQLLDNGELEMLVAGSASGDRPTDFSADQKSLHIYYRATPTVQE